MGRRLPASTARAARAVRGLWPDRNPLRRGVDRVEALLAGLLAIAFLAGAPLAATVTAQPAFRAGARAAATELSWRRVPAVLLASGTLSVPPGERAGSTVMIWVDTSGRVTGLPLERSQVRSQAVLAAVFAVAAAGAVALCLGLLAHAALDRRRLAAWELDWQLTEPRWTRQR
jgi:hypothetical protein